MDCSKFSQHDLVQNILALEVHVGVYLYDIDKIKATSKCTGCAGGIDCLLDKITSFELYLSEPSKRLIKVKCPNRSSDIVRDIKRELNTQ